MPEQAKIGFLGFGNMAQAMAKGFLRSGAVAPPRISACAKHWDKLKRTAEALGIVPCRDALETVGRSNILVAAVKPYLMEEVLSPLREVLRGKVLISVAAGWDFERLNALMGPEVHCLGIMPNTPVAVCEGVVLIEETHSLTEDEYKTARELLGLLGTAEALPSAQMTAAGKLSGCGPAFAAMFLEALGDAGVYHGLPRQLAYRLAAQMLAGTGKLQLETGDHPGVMKDAVCSPGGSTIAGVEQLERDGFRAAVINAIDAVKNR